MTITLRPAKPGDAQAIACIYNHYIRETVVTFEEDEISGETMAGRIQGILDASLPWLVAEDQDSIVGYAYAGKWHARCAYRHSVETTVYLDPLRMGRGIGTKLYRELLSLLRAKSVHVVIGAIALPNAASVALHERLGFSKVGHFKEVGFKFGRWLDVGYWQLAP